MSEVCSVVEGSGLENRERASVPWVVAYPHSHCVLVD